MRRKAIVILSILYVLLMVATFIIKNMNGHPPNWKDMLGRTIVSILPLLLLFCKRIPFPLPLIIVFYIFIFCTFFLGAILKFYDRFHWWDIVLHVFGAGFMAFVAISLYLIIIPASYEQAISGWLIFIFVLSFAVLSSTIWEILEFIGSQIGSMKADSQKDTMTDQIAGFSGACIVAIYALIRKKARKLRAVTVENNA